MTQITRCERDHSMPQIIMQTISPSARDSHNPRRVFVSAGLVMSRSLLRCSGIPLSSHGRGAHHRQLAEAMHLLQQHPPTEAMHLLPHRPAKPTTTIATKRCAACIPTHRRPPSNLHTPDLIASPARCHRTSASAGLDTRPSSPTRSRGSSGSGSGSRRHRSQALHSRVPLGVTPRTSERALWVSTQRAALRRCIPALRRGRKSRGGRPAGRRRGDSNRRAPRGTRLRVCSRLPRPSRPARWPATRRWSAASRLWPAARWTS